MIYLSNLWRTRPSKSANNHTPGGEPEVLNGIYVVSGSRVGALNQFINKIMNSAFDEKHRIAVIDALRGLAVISIALLHAIEHFNLTVFPEQQSEFMRNSDKIIQLIVTSVTIGKGYSIFALLFGFTFHIQLQNRARHGEDFKYRFIWRMMLLFMIGTLNSAFYYGEILVLYSCVALVLIPLRHASNKNLILVALFFMLQPLLLAKIAYYLISPEITLHPERYTPNEILTKLSDNSFIEMIKTNLNDGRRLYWLSILTNGERVFHTASLFIFGMILGRKKFFEHSINSDVFWKKVLIYSLTVIIITKMLVVFTRFYMDYIAVENMIVIILNSWSNFAIIMLISAIFYKIYSGKLKSKIKFIEYFGIMSLSNYLFQSVLGSFVFYGYGLSLSKSSGVTVSFLIGIIILVIQWIFCKWWLKNHDKGFIEQLWHNLTWIKVKNNAKFA